MTIKDIKTGEYNPYYGQYLLKIPEEESLIPLLERLKNEFSQLLDEIKETSLQYSYAEGKWTVIQVLQHMIDTERIFQYRALTFARGDNAILPGFDQEMYVTISEAEKRNITDIKNEFVSVRNSGISLFKSFTVDMLTKTGKASNSDLSVRAAGFILCGHQIHHQELFKNLYGL